TGDRIDKLIKMTNFNAEEGLPRFQRIVDKMGVEAALREMGIKDGDTVRIGDMEFEFTD
ncbi:MAG: Obg family GTPase CgtA, partial [Syntrophomonadaceae bacterium]|nr:Obg family GTPase CgtA [Syntrophomonadaceae bacterium]